MAIQFPKLQLVLMELLKNCHQQYFGEGSSLSGSSAEIGWIYLDNLMGKNMQYWRKHLKSIIETDDG